MVMITMVAQAFNDTLAAFGRAFRHNAMAAPSFIATEAARYYLPTRMDGREACSATGDGTHEPGSPVIPRCCQVMIWWPQTCPPSAHTQEGVESSYFVWCNVEVDPVSDAHVGVREFLAGPEYAVLGGCAAGGYTHRCRTSWHARTTALRLAV